MGFEPQADWFGSVLLTLVFLITTWVCKVVFSAGLHTLEQADSSVAFELAFSYLGLKDAAVCPGSCVRAQRQQWLPKDGVGPRVEAENPPGRILLLFVFSFQLFKPYRCAHLTAATLASTAFQGHCLE